MLLQRKKANSLVPAVFSHCMAFLEKGEGLVLVHVFLFSVRSQIYQGQVSAQGILHLVNPNLGSNSGIRILSPEFGVEFLGRIFWSYVSNKKGPLKNSPPRNSLPKIHIKKFTPESGLKNSHCTSARPFC